MPVRMRYQGSTLFLDDAELFVGDVDQLIAELTRLRETGRPELVVTPNVDQAINLEDNVAFRESFRRASLRIIDGMPLVALGRALGAASAVRFTGAELLPLLAGIASQRGWRVAVLGGANGVAEQAASNLNDRVGGACVVAVPLPKLESADDPNARDAIVELRRHSPDFVFICLGSPKQELWFESWRASLPSAVYIGAGAAIDFAAGTASRAPRVVQRLGLEWGWRLAQDPKRLAHRYLVKGPRFIGIAGRSLRRL